MSYIIDRRSTYNKNKNISNRQRYIDRIKDQVRDSVSQNIQNKKLGDLAKGDNVKVKVKNTKEPSFQQDSDSGDKDYVLPGNKDFVTGDRIKQPQKGKGGRGTKGDLSEDSEDDFAFTLTREEFLSILFEDLELPDLVKKDILGAKSFKPERRGFSTDGNPCNLDIQRTAKNAIGRRLALNRPSKKEIAELEEQMAALELKKSTELYTDNDYQLYIELTDKARKLKRKKSAIPYFDPIDVRYRRFEKVPKPISNAVMFCMMDVSGSMGEPEKDLAKRFFLLLYLFLNQKYEKVELIFIRHTTHAEEVDEQTFFYDPQSGGTQISSGLELIDEIITKRFDIDKTNIYVAQATDGENYSGDNQTCYDIITTKLVNKIQYFAYIEVAPRSNYMYGNTYSNEDAELWDLYKTISREHPHIQARRVTSKKEIFDVFADLFRKKQEVK